MFNDYTLEVKISDYLVEKSLSDRGSHVSSGKLSASILSWPLQWQMLKVIGIEQKEPDEYLLRKFLRGNHCEEWLIQHIPGLVETQREVEYMGAIGFIDAVVDSSNWQHEIGIIPHEIKSVANSKFKRILQQKEADPGHKLQATLYALALKSDYYAIDYIASDDYRTLTFIYDTNDTSDEVVDIISNFKIAFSLGLVAEFEPRYQWQSNLKYCSYPEWMNLSSAEINEKIEKEYPKSFIKLQYLKEIYGKPAK